jgi:hypothetical protein
VSAPLRPALERLSIPVLTYLRSLPRPVMFALTLGMVVGGLFAPPPVGPALLLVIAGMIGWITYLAWPVLPRNGRLSRILVMLLVLGAAVEAAVNG